MLNDSIVTRFWSHVHKSSGCWNWTASKYLNGYGQFVIRGEPRTPAHRTSYRITCGEIPDGVCVLHRCDNRECVRPDHLFLGTRLDNTQDALKKGRIAHGNKSGNAVLSETKVWKIRSSFLKGKTQKELAKIFSVSQSCISKITCGNRWKHLKINRLESSGRHAKGEKCPCAKLTEQDVKWIRRFSYSGTKNSELAKAFGVSRVLIGLIVRQKVWKWVK